MISYEQDPDVVRWGQQLFDASPYSNCRYCGAVTQDNADCYHGHYFREEDYNNDFTNIENEVMSHALQQQFSQLAVTEASESSYDWSENMLPSNSLQEWLIYPMDSYFPEQQNDQEEADDVEPCSSCSSPGENSYCGDQWFHSLEQIDEYPLDGEVGKRLNQMVPIPHVPRINGEIPSIDEATLDHQRLLHRLQLYELVESKVEGDGNCQFRALSDQIYRTPEHHKFVREQVVNQLKSYPDIYEGYVPMAYADYLEKMAKNSEWGDHVTLQAAADSYGVKIFVITSFKDTCYIEILPNFERSKRVICLSFWAEVHYNSIYPEGGPQNDM